MKGMQAISRGSGFGGLAKYGMTNASGEVEGRIIGGNMSGTTAEELTKEFGLSRKVRPDIKKPVWHNSLRSPKDEKLTDEQFNVLWNFSEMPYDMSLWYETQKLVEDGNTTHPLVTSGAAESAKREYGKLVDWASKLKV